MKAKFLETDGKAGITLKKYSIKTRLHVGAGIVFQVYPSTHVRNMIFTFFFFIFFLPKEDLLHYANFGVRG